MLAYHSDDETVTAFLQRHKHIFGIEADVDYNDNTLLPLWSARHGINEQTNVQRDIDTCMLMHAHMEMQNRLKVDVNIEIKVM